MESRRIWRVKVLLMVVGTLACSPAFPQQPPDPGSTQAPGSTQDSGSVSESSADSATVTSQGQPNPAAGTQGLFVRALNSASPLVGENGPLQWGWVSVRSASFLQYFTNVTVNVPNAPAQSQDLNAGQLSVAIVLDHAFGASHGSHLTFQYTPGLYITNGHVYSSALNQNAGVDTMVQLNPRWSLQLSDRFTYYASQRAFSGLSLDANYTLGKVVQNNFLNGPGSVLSNTASASFSYLWSPVTTVSFAPTFGYQSASGAINSQANLSAFYEGGQLSVSHSLSPTQTVSLTYLGEHASFTNSSPTVGPRSNQFLQDLLLGYGKQIGASWHFSAGLGVVSNTGYDSRTGLGASAGITKSFHVMDFALSYNRGHQFNGYITGASSDRVDFVHTIRWNQRLKTSTSLSYFRSDGTTVSAVLQTGKYGTEQLSFGLTRSLSLTGGISYTAQTGDGVYVLSGHRRFGTVGITWSTPALQSPGQY